MHLTDLKQGLFDSTTLLVISLLEIDDTRKCTRYKSSLAVRIFKRQKPVGPVKDGFALWSRFWAS